MANKVQDFKKEFSAILKCTLYHHANKNVSMQIKLDNNRNQKSVIAVSEPNLYSRFLIY